MIAFATSGGTEFRLGPWTNMSITSSVLAFPAEEKSAGETVT